MDRCPKCGAEFYREWEDGYGDAHSDYRCDTVENQEDGALIESATCLRNQLAAANERADRAEELLGRIYEWQVRHEGRAHNIMAGDEPWVEDECPLCIFDDIVDDLSGLAAKANREGK